MTVTELIRALEELDEPDAKVVVTYQPGYPLVAALDGIWQDCDAGMGPVGCVDEDYEVDDRVHLVAGRDLGHGKRVAHDECWS